MSIELIRLGAGGVIIAIEGEESWQNFKDLVQNGSGLYPDLPAETKKFADEVTVGKVLQDYKDDPKNRKSVTVEEIEEAFAFPGEKVEAKYCTHCGNLDPIDRTKCTKCKRIFKAIINRSN